MTVTKYDDIENVRQGIEHCPGNPCTKCFFNGHDVSCSKARVKYIVPLLDELIAFRDAEAAEQEAAVHIHVQRDCIDEDGIDEIVRTVRRVLGKGVDQ